MTPVYQRILPPYTGRPSGDCLRAVVASILDMPLEAVPHFMGDADTAAAWPVALSEWLSERGLELEALAPPGDLSAVLKHMASHYPGEHYILGGKTGADFGHVVVALGDKIVHDPAPNVPPGVVSLQGPLPSGRYACMIIRPKCTPVLPAPIDFEPLSRHDNTALLLSGGKDSIALVYLFRPYLDRITVYHCDTGDLMPETNEIVARLEGMCPRFVRIKTDVRGWIAQNGIPTDLLPVHCGPIGRLMHHGVAGKVAITDKHLCCGANRWAPVQQRLATDGVTLRIHGTRRAEPGYGLAEALAGERMSARSFRALGMAAHQEVWLPLEDWSDEQVFAYLQSVGAPVASYYEHIRKGVECARCPADWGEGRGAYLRQHHPDLAADYARDLATMRDEILKPLAHLKSELDALRR